MISVPWSCQHVAGDLFYNVFYKCFVKIIVRVVGVVQVFDVALFYYICVNDFGARNISLI